VIILFLISLTNEPSNLNSYTVVFQRNGLFHNCLGKAIYATYGALIVIHAQLFRQGSVTIPLCAGAHVHNLSYDYGRQNNLKSYAGTGPDVVFE